MKNLFLFLLVLPQVSFSFTLLTGTAADKAAVGWKSKTVQFDIDTSCTDYKPAVESAIRSAIDAWNGVSTADLEIKVGDTVALPDAITTYVGNSASQYAPVGNPIVYCDTNFEANSGAEADSIPGFASSYNIDSSEKITGALLVLNFQTVGDASLLNMDTVAANVVLTHEIGHVLGLGHSNDTNALMYYSTGPTRKLVLAKDDMDGITFLYPRNELDFNSMMGCGLIQTPTDPEFRNKILSQYMMYLLIFFLFTRNFRKKNSVRFVA